MFFLSCENPCRTWGPLALVTKDLGAVKISTTLPRGNGEGRVCEKGEIKKVIKGGRLRLLIFSRKGGENADKIQ